MVNYKLNLGITWRVALKLKKANKIEHVLINIKRANKIKDVLINIRLAFRLVKAINIRLAFRQGKAINIRLAFRMRRALRVNYAAPVIVNNHSLNKKKYVLFIKQKRWLILKNSISNLPKLNLFYTTQK